MHEQPSWDKFNAIYIYDINPQAIKWDLCQRLLIWHIYMI
jgi:hypothetical protein